VATYIACYLVTFVVFAAIDIAWLMSMASTLYKPTLGDILLPTVRVGPAIAFYLLFPAGIVIFAVMPGLKSGSLATALMLGALFGLFTYATYDLTNFATLRNWTFNITLIDIVYGAAASGVAAAAGYALAPTVAGLFGAR
jgi:uncharacterized membrane protein